MHITSLVNRAIHAVNHHMETVRIYETYRLHGRREDVLRIVRRRLGIHQID